MKINTTLVTMGLVLTLSGCMSQQIVHTAAGGLSEATQNWCSPAHTLKRKALVLALKQQDPDYVSVCDVVLVVEGEEEGVDTK